MSLYNCYAVRVRDPVCVYKLATIDNVATVYMGHADVHSSARAVASRTVSPLTKLAIKSLVNTAKASMTSIYKCVRTYSNIAWT